MKTAIVTLSAAILIGAAPAALARDASGKTPDQHHRVSKSASANISGHASWRVRANGVKTGSPGAYAPGAAKDYTYENSRNGGGGGGGSGM